MGCDEMSVRKGHRYVSLFCDLAGKRVLFATEGRDKATWERFVAALAAHNGHPRAIVEVSMDMSPAYIAGVEENCGSQAVMVFDKYHVIAHANAGVDAVRRAEMRLGFASTRAALKGSRWVWLKNGPTGPTNSGRPTSVWRAATCSRARPTRCGWCCKNSTNCRRRG